MAVVAAVGGADGHLHASRQADGAQVGGVCTGIVGNDANDVALQAVGIGGGVAGGIAVAELMALATDGHGAGDVFLA